MSESASSEAHNEVQATSQDGGFWLSMGVLALAAAFIGLGFAIAFLLV